MIGVCTLNFPPSCYLLLVEPILWLGKNFLICLVFLQGWLVWKKCSPRPCLLLHRGSSLQLYSFLLLEIYLCPWCVVISLWMSLLWRLCSSQRLSWGSVKASKVCLGLKVNCVCHYNKRKYAKCWLNLIGIWNVCLVTKPVCIIWTSDIVHSRRTSPHGECQVKAQLSHTCNLNHL